MAAPRTRGLAPHIYQEKSSRRRISAPMLWRLLILEVLLLSGLAWACPMCSPSSSTLTEQLEKATAVVIAEPHKEKKLVVTRVLKGPVLSGKILLAGRTQSKTVLHYTSGAPEAVFWNGTPRNAEGALAGFASGLMRLPSRESQAGVAKRLAFMVPYLEHADPLIAEAATDEFSRAELSQVHRFAPKLGRRKLVAWISDRSIPQSRKAVYFVMLGQVGQPSDLPLLESKLARIRQGTGPGVAPLLACYLSLKGPAGLALVERDFLAPETPHALQMTTLEALRFHADFDTNIPRAKILKTYEKLLDDPDRAGYILRDLALWRHWSIVPKLVPLYRSDKRKRSWMKASVLRFLLSCPTPAAKRALAELRREDPEFANSVKRPFRGDPGDP